MFLLRKYIHLTHTESGVTPLTDGGICYGIKLQMSCLTDRVRIASFNLFNFSGIQNILHSGLQLEYRIFSMIIFLFRESS